MHVRELTERARWRVEAEREAPRDPWEAAAKRPVEGAVELRKRVHGEVVVLVGPLVGAEEVQLVLDDGTAQRAAPLVAAVLRLAAGGGIDPRLRELVEAHCRPDAKKLQPRAGGRLHAALWHGRPPA